MQRLATTADLESTTTTDMTDARRAGIRTPSPRSPIPACPRSRRDTRSAATARHVAAHRGSPTRHGYSQHSRPRTGDERLAADGFQNAQIFFQRAVLAVVKPPQSCPCLRAVERGDVYRSRTRIREIEGCFLFSVFLCVTSAFSAALR